MVGLHRDVIDLDVVLVGDDLGTGLRVPLELGVLLDVLRDQVVLEHLLPCLLAALHAESVL